MAGRIPQQFIDELMSRVDIVEIIDARVPLKKSGRDYTACCPFHDEKTPSFTVSQQKQFYHCFGCGAHGTALGFLMEYEHLDFLEAVHDLASQAGMQVPQQVTTPAAAQAGKDLYALLEQAARFYARQLREHADAPRAVEYLKRRGVSGEIAADYGIGFAPPGWDNLLRALGAAQNKALQAQLAQAGMLVEKDGGGYYDRFRDRILFPIHDARGRVIGFGGRVLGEDEAQGRAMAKDSASAAEGPLQAPSFARHYPIPGGRTTPGATSPKYLNSPETPLFHKGRELYGLYQARKRTRNLERLLVVEGYMDVVALAQHGIHYAVATLGTATTREHLERLFRVVPEIVFCFDGDRAGREAAWRALENSLPVMREGRQAYFLFLPDGEDPDSLVRKEGAQRFTVRLAQATPFSEFFYETLRKKADITSMEGRARLVELARPLLSKLSAGVFRHMMVTRLAELTRMDVSVLTPMLGLGKLPATAARRPVQTIKRTDGRRPAPRMTPVRLAIALLLQQPALAALAGDPARWTEAQIPGLNLLTSLLHALQAQPQLSCAALLERWRDTEDGRHLMRLAQWRHEIPEDGIEAEFRGALARIDDQGVEQRKERLIDKSRGGELTAEERLEWQRLFKL
ncbi:MAG: DNA primase [Pseudomonadota bacterium]